MIFHVSWLFCVFEKIVGAGSVQSKCSKSTQGKFFASAIKLGRGIVW